MRRKTWPSNKALPRFSSEAEELTFWETHDVPWDERAEAEEVPGPTVAIAAKTVKVTLPARQQAALGRLAKQGHVSKEQALEAIIGKALRAPRAARRKRAAGA